MATEQELADAKAQLARYEEESQRRAKADAIAGTLSKYDLATGAAEQLRVLIEPTVGVTKVADGRVVVFGPNYIPLESHVSKMLEQPSFVHFLKQKDSASPASPQAGMSPLPPAAPTPSGVREILPGETFGAAVARVTLANQAEPKADPRLDSSQPLALGPRTLPRR